MKRRINNRYRNTSDREWSFIGLLRLTLLSAWVVVILLLSLLEGCTLTDVEDRPGAITEADGVFSLNVLSTETLQTRSLTFTENSTMETNSSFFVTGDSAITKATAALEANENVIRRLWVGQYAIGGQLLYSKYISSTSGEMIDLRLKVTQSPCVVYFVANVDSLTGVDTEATFKSCRLAHNTTDDGSPTSGLLIMKGSWTGTVSHGGVSGTVDMERLAARISLIYYLSDPTPGFSFDVKRVLLCGVPQTFQLVEPEGQLSNIGYRSYTGTCGNSGETHVFWYLPENKAGIATGSNTVGSEKEKTGKGVSNAAYIEIAGNARQGNVAYNNVAFKLYLGSGGDNSWNNYMVRRNSHYIVHFRIKGIDLSDKRVSVGEIPNITDPGNMDPQVDKTKKVQVTARPGFEWQIQLPDWLSATIGGAAYSAGSTAAGKGPMEIEFKAANSNPKAEQRSHKFSIGTAPNQKEFTITQNASWLNVYGENLNLYQWASGSTFIFEATGGLNFQGSVSYDNTSVTPWLNLSGIIEDRIDVAGGNRSFDYWTLANPGSSIRYANVNVKVGEMIGSVRVSQAASSLTVSEAEKTVGVWGATGLSSTFTTTQGLPWQVTKNNGMDWLSITSTPTSGYSPNGSAQAFTYNVAANESAERSGYIIVKVGDGLKATNPDNNLIKTIRIKQDGAYLNMLTDNIAFLSGGACNLNNSLAWEIRFEGTSGLPVYGRTICDWVTFGQGNQGVLNGLHQNFVIEAAVNPNSTQRETDVYIEAGNNRTLRRSVKVTQVGSEFGIYVRGVSTGGGSPLQPISSVTLTYDGKSGDGNIYVEGTSGLSWTITYLSGSNVGNGDILFNIDSQVIPSGFLGRGINRLQIVASPNVTETDRTAVFKFSTVGGDGSHDKILTMTQKANPNFIVIDQTVANAYQLAANGDVKYQAFNYDQGSNGSTKGADLNGNSSTYKVTTAYKIQVSDNQPTSKYSYNTGSARKQCAAAEGWRLPTHIELFAMMSKNDLNPALLNGLYWSASVYVKIGSSAGARSKVDMNTRALSNKTGVNCYVRCVKEVN